MRRSACTHERVSAREFGSHKNNISRDENNNLHESTNGFLTIQRDLSPTQNIDTLIDEYGSILPPNVRLTLSKHVLDSNQDLIILVSH